MAQMPELQEFEGRWSLTRVIDDRMTGGQGQLSGEVIFEPSDTGGLSYLETGTLSFGNQPAMAATRRYVWRQTEGGIAVSFEDGRPFHVILTDRLMPDANHHCDPDLYNVSYDFTRWPAWSSEWRVVGPRKDYRMMSEFQRI